jgi:hypothetical protein
MASLVVGFNLVTWGMSSHNIKKRATASRSMIYLLFVVTTFGDLLIIWCYHAPFSVIQLKLRGSQISSKYLGQWPQCEWKVCLEFLKDCTIEVVSLDTKNHAVVEDWPPLAAP